MRATGVKLPNLHPSTWAYLLVRGCCHYSYCKWAIWIARNDRRHSKPRWKPDQAVQWVTDTALLTSHMVSPAKPKKAPQIEKWAPQPRGWHKVTTDGAFHPSSARGAGGVVIRDSRGLFTAATAQWYEILLEALVAEAMVCRDGAFFAKSLGLS